MANHHSEFSNAKSDVLSEIREALSRNTKPMTPDQLLGDYKELQASLGKTGDYPAGQYGKMDEGGIRMAIATDKRNGKVALDFGTPVTWLAFDPDQARWLGERLIAGADDVAKRGRTMSRKRKRVRSLPTKAT